MDNLASICCNALVRVAGEGTTHWWVCTACEQPTDVKPTPNQLQIYSKLEVPCSAPSPIGMSPSL